MRLSALFFLMPVLAASVYGQTYLDSAQTVKKTTSTLLLDGFLDEPLWADASKFHFFEYGPNWGGPDSLTTLYLTFNDTHLLVGFQADMMTPEKLVARNLRRDGYYGDDYFAFQIDPNRTRKNSFAFSTYPTGARYDASTSNNNIPLAGAVRATVPTTCFGTQRFRSPKRVGRANFKFRFPICVSKFEKGR